MKIMYTTQSKCHRKYQNQAIAKFIHQFEQQQQTMRLSAFTSQHTIERNKCRNDEKKLHSQKTHQQNIKSESTKSI